MFTVEYKSRRPRPRDHFQDIALETSPPTPEPVITHTFTEKSHSPLATDDRLNIAVVAMTDALFKPLATQIMRGIGDLDRRKKFRDLIRNVFNGMDTHKAADVRVAFWARRNSPTVIISQRDRWWIKHEPTYLWNGRRGVSLVGVDCHTTFHVPAHERDDCSAWIERQRDRLDAHFAKRLVSASSTQGGM